MKDPKRLMYILAGIISAVIIMILRGILSADDSLSRIMCICDGFSVSGLLFLSAALMMFISGEGGFDMLGYAVRKGIHHLIPGRSGEDAETFYDHISAKHGRNIPSGTKNILFSGILDLSVGLILTVVWYNLSGQT